MTTVSEAISSDAGAIGGSVSAWESSSSGESKRVLMICAAFPPTGGPGVQRTAKFAKYLPQFGWRPTVWTTQHLPPLPRDPSLLHDIPDAVDIHRFETPSAGGDDAGGHWRWRRLRQRAAALTPPDYLAGWAKRSTAPLLRMIRRENIDAIYSTYSPPSCHVLAQRLKRHTQLPWVADFRDLWTDDYGYHAPGWRRWLDRRMETSFLGDADRIIAVSDGQRDILAKRISGNREKVLTITNGFDPDDFEGASHDAARHALHGPSNRFVLLFCGWFLSDRVPSALPDALARYADRCRQQGRALELRIVGAISDQLRDRIQNAGVNIVATGYLPHDAALCHLNAADALLMLVPTAGAGDTLIPGKCFEYIASGRPILLIGPTGGEAAKLVRQFDAGIVSAPNEKHMVAALERLTLCTNDQSSRQMDKAMLEAISRVQLTGRLANVLDDVTATVQRDIRS